MKLISACLCGVNCKYNGKNNFDPLFLELLKKGEVFPVCPEQLGGLPTPRSACEIQCGTGLDVINGSARVVTEAGLDVSDYFRRGAAEVLALAQHIGAVEAILQRRSPSCGVNQIYDGTFSGKLIEGDGVCSALLKCNGIKIINDQTFEA